MSPYLLWSGANLVIFGGLTRGGLDVNFPGSFKATFLYADLNLLTNLPSDSYWIFKPLLSILSSLPLSIVNFALDSYGDLPWTLAIIFLDSDTFWNFS